ncbi:MAG: DDE-type integrase/transposase/recombinase [Phycisphaerae bacterium]|nr:DDE-type integrase/transposase/recombinase [Phycisphaerae bacterium]
MCVENPHKRKRELAGWVVAEANSEDPTLKISLRSLEAWEGNHHRKGFKGLIDRYGVTAITRTGTRTGGQCRSAEAVQFFYDIYRTNQRRTVRQCHELARSEARRHDWQWPSSYRATAVWLNRYDDRATTCLMREGMEAWRHKYMPYLEQDYAKLAAGDMYVCDHHEFKCFVRYRGKTIRPWLTGIMDAATRVLVGWHVGPAPHTDAILASIRNAFEGWGVPRRVKIDNGKDYDSKVLTGTTKSELRKLKRELGKDWKDIIRRERAKTELNPCGWFGVLPEFGCEIIRAIPYQPQSKLIERYFLTVSNQFTRTLATFCDTSPERKPEALPEVLEDVAAIPELEDLATDFAAWLEEYHHAAHRGDGMNGRSPLAAWESSPAQPAKAQADALGLMVNVRGSYKVGGNGVRVKIGATTIGYGQYDTSLQRWKGRKVLVAVDSSDVSYALVYTPERAKRQLICRAEANERISPCATANDMREAQAAINRARRDAKRARASAAATMKTTARIASEAAAHRRKELLATGTDNATSGTGVSPVNGKTSSTGVSPTTPIAIIQTGFEAASKQVKGLVSPPPEQSEAMLHDLATASTALGFGRGLAPKPPTTNERAPVSLLLGEKGLSTDQSPEDDGEGDSDTDVGDTATDLLLLVAGRCRQ